MSKHQAGMYEKKLASIIIVDNLPVVPAEKYDKLHSILSKLFSSVSDSTVVTFELCKNEDESSDQFGGTLGYAFVQYASQAEAMRALQKLDNHKLDKTHIFRVCMFQDWEKLRDVPDVYEPPQFGQQQQQQIEDSSLLQKWLVDESSREQYLVRHGEDTEVWWHDPIALKKQSLDERRTAWTESVARWSPLGTYMATLHPQGVKLWGGPEWKDLRRFQHPQVQLIDFSPNEKYLVTWYQNMSIFEVQTQKPLKQFPGGPSQQHGWPVFKWSHDDQFFGKLSEDNIHIYEAATMKLIQPDPKKNTTIYIPHVKAFEWSPTDNILCYWVPEQDEQPARVVLLKVVVAPRAGTDKSTPGKIISFEQLTQRNLFRVEDIRLHWQNDGDFLCVKVDRLKKDAKSREKVTSFELFRMRSGSSIAVEVVELTEEVIAFSWEPKGFRFAVIHKSAQARLPTVSFYSMSGVKEGKVVCLQSLPRKEANHLFWSPKGTFIVLAGLRELNGKLEFWNCDDLEIRGGGEHFMCTNVDWDPSGRYVATSVSYYRTQMENGFNIWTFQGKQIVNVSRERLYEFLWRPRPPSILDDKRLANISKTLTSRMAKYQKEERMLERQEQDTHNRLRREKVDEFAALVQRRRYEMRHMAQERRAARRRVMQVAGYAAEEYVDSDEEQQQQEAAMVTMESAITETLEILQEDELQ